MKQTNSAIKFLMAQYRAIFKNANLKMILAATAAVASLSVGAANAAVDTALDTEAKWNAAFKADDAKVEITGNTADKGTSGKYQNIALAGTEANNGGLTLNFKEGQKLVISNTTSEASANTISATATNKISILGGGDIDITATNKDGKQHGLTVNADGGEVDVDVGNVSVQGSLVVKTGTANTSNASFIAKKLTIGDGKFTAGDANKQAGIADVTVGDKTGSGSISFGANVVVINKDAKVSIVGIDGGEGVEFGADTLTLNGGVISFEAAEASATNAKAKYTADQSVINGGVLAVQDGAKASLEVDTMDVRNGANIVLGDNLTLESGVVTIREDAVLAASAAKGMLTLSTAGTHEDDTAVVELGSQTLKSYLTGKAADGKTALQYTDESKVFTEADASKHLSDAVAGGITLKDGGTLKVTDFSTVEVSGETIFKFSDTAGAGVIKAEAGSTIMGKSLAVSKALQHASNVEVSAEHLTLGSAEFDGSTSLGVGNFWAENVTFVPNKSSKEFVLKDELELENATSGVVDGNVNVDGGHITILAGKYTFNGDVTLTAAQSQTPALNLDGAGTYAKFNGKLTTSVEDALYTEDGVIDANGVTEYKVAAKSIHLHDVGELMLNASKFITLTGTDTLAFDSAKFDPKAIKGDNFSTVHLNGLGSMTMAQYKSLLTQTGFGGFYKGFNISDSDAAAKMTFDDAKVLSGTPDSVYKNTQMTVGAAITDKSYSFGGVKLSTGDKLEITSTSDSGAMIKLTNSNVNSKGQFIEKADGSVGGVHFSGDKAHLMLLGTGKIGDVTAENAGNNVLEHGALVIGEVHQVGTANVEVDGNIGSTTAPLNVVFVSPGSSLTVKGDKVFSKELYLAQGSTVDAKEADITLDYNHSGVSSEDYISVEIMGDLTAKSLTLAKPAENNDRDAHIITSDANVTLDSLTISQGAGTLLVVDGAIVKAKTFTAASGTLLQVGQDHEIGRGATIIADTLDLGSGSVFVDPEFGQEASYLIVNNLKDAQINGKVTVGKNAVTAIGFDNKKDVQATITDYLDANTGSFRPGSNVQNALILNKGITLGASDEITLDPSASGVSPAAGTGNVSFGQGGALVVTDAALTDAQGNKTLPAITLDSSKTVDASDGGVVLLSGKFSAADTNLKIFSGASVKITGADLPVMSVNGTLSGTLKADSDGTVSELKLDTDKLNSQMSRVAAPVKDLVSKVLGKESKQYVTGGLGADYLYDVATTSNTGVEIDAVSHAATYAGAQQAAIAAVGTLAEAVAGRIGSTGIETTVLAATGSHAHGGVWVTPMYKSVKSDGFDAQGGTYGADVDLAGVTFGADSVRGALRFGAAFNIGSGDADGKGNGQGIKDEFDYYGFGMYAGMDFSHCSLIADASVNVISHDVEGYSGHKDFGNVNAKADTTAVTMGVTGQYTLVTEVADVTPHVGMRFTRLDTDSYEMKTKKGTIGTTDFDVQNVFSIPVGVTLSKAFENHGWVFSPVADFTLTFNAGDTEAKSNVRFDGVKVNTSLETEVMDKVTYGLNLGFGAQSGNFGTSISVGYTGSSNTDSVGVNANARYMF